MSSAIGNKLRARREELRLLQKQVAHMLGCNTQYLSMVERGVRTPSVKWLQNAAEVLRLDLLRSRTRSSTLRPTSE